MSTFYADISKNDRKAFNETLRNLDLVSDNEAMELAIDLLIKADRAKKLGLKMAWTDASGKVVAYLEQDKQKPATTNVVKAARPAAASKNTILKQ